MCVAGVEWVVWVMDGGCRVVVVVRGECWERVVKG